MFLFRLFDTEAMTALVRNEMKKQENQKPYCNGIDDNPVNDLWTNGIIYAFEFVRGHKKSLSSPQVVNDAAKKQVSKKPVSSHELSNSLRSRMNKNNSRESPPLANSRVGQNNVECNNHSQDSHSGRFCAKEGVPRNCWVPIGWDRISELVQTVQVDACWEEPNGFTEDDDDVTVAHVAAPYWERPVGPTWWCYVDAGHPYINLWLSTAQWLHPAVSIALRDEGKLISERMKHLLYEVTYSFIFETILPLIALPTYRAEWLI